MALEVGIGVAFAGGRSIVTMKHVGLNVAADPLFTVAYTGVEGALVIVSADDPGMASSQNEQDNRRFAVAAGVPMLEPADSQEAYDFTLRAIEISERWRIPVLLRMTTRVCHSKTIVVTPGYPVPPARVPAFVRSVPERVMIPAYARPPTCACAPSWPRSKRGTNTRAQRFASTAIASSASSPRALPTSTYARRLQPLVC